MQETTTADGIKVHCAHSAIAKITALKPNPANPNRHPKEQVKLLAKIIQAQGWRNPIVVSRQSGLIVKGHGRFEAAVLYGATEVPIDQQDYASPEQEKEDMIADNRIAELADMDHEAVGKLLRELQEAQRDLELAGYQKEAVEKLLGTNTRELQEALKVERVKLQWGKFKVFHVAFANQVFCADNLNWLMSFGVEKGGLPKRRRTDTTTLFIDSGMLTLAKDDGIKAISRQSEVIDYAERCAADWVAMMDIPLIPEILSGLGIDKQRAYQLMYKNAEKFAAHPTGIRKVFVCQGQTLSDYKSNAKELANYATPKDVIAIGSIKNRADEAQAIAAICAVVHQQFPTNDIHLLGVTNNKAIRAAIQYGATSCDSATAAGTVGRGEIMFCKKEGGEYVLRHELLANLIGEPNISVGGALFTKLIAFSASQVEAAMALSMVMEEAAILYNAGLRTNVLENPTA